MVSGIANTHAVAVPMQRAVRKVLPSNILLLLEETRKDGAFLAMLGCWDRGKLGSVKELVAG
jgi:hypothetical protein